MAAADIKKSRTDGTGARPFVFSPDPRGETGRLGEDVAAVWLGRQGYSIIGRRVRAAGVEIDILARRGDEIILVEVKARCGDSFGSPEESITFFKRSRLRRAALSLAGESGRAVRIDVIAVLLPERPGQPARLRHIPYAVGEE